MDQFSQSQREALIELMCLAIAIDGRISPAEETAMHHLLDQIGWQGERPREILLLHALTEARDIAGDEKCVVAFLASRAAQFKTRDEQERALKFLMLALEIDGMDKAEETFLARVEAAFNQ